MDEETSKQTGKFSIQHGSNILHSLKGNKNKTEKKKKQVLHGRKCIPGLPIKNAVLQRK